LTCSPFLRSLRESGESGRFGERGGRAVGCLQRRNLRTIMEGGNDRSALCRLSSPLWDRAELCYPCSRLHRPERPSQERHLSRRNYLLHCYQKGRIGAQHTLDRRLAHAPDLRRRACFCRAWRRHDHQHRIGGRHRLNGVCTCVWIGPEACRGARQDRSPPKERTMARIA
jgi:hypothetical protein